MASICICVLVFVFVFVCVVIYLLADGVSGHDWALAKRARGNKTSVGVSGIGGGRLPLVRNHHHLRGNSSPLQ